MEGRVQGGDPLGEGLTWERISGETNLPLWDQPLQCAAECVPPWPVPGTLQDSSYTLSKLETQYIVSAVV